MRKMKKSQCSKMWWRLESRLIKIIINIKLIIKRIHFALELFFSFACKNYNISVEKINSVQREDETLISSRHSYPVFPSVHYIVECIHAVRQCASSNASKPTKSHQILAWYMYDCMIIIIIRYSLLLTLVYLTVEQICCSFHKQNYVCVMKWKWHAKNELPQWILPINCTG